VAVFFAILLMLFAMLLRRCTLIGDLTSVLDLITVFSGVKRWGSGDRSPPAAPVASLGDEVPQKLTHSIARETLFCT